METLLFYDREIFLVQIYQALPVSAPVAFAGPYLAIGLTGTQLQSSYTSIGKTPKRAFTMYEKLIVQIGRQCFACGSFRRLEMPLSTNTCSPVSWR